MTDSRRHLVVLDNGLLLSLAQQEEFTREFPFLKQLHGVRGSCGGCQRASHTQNQLLNSAKQAFQALTGERKAKLKELLNARQLRVTYLTATAKPRKLQITF